MGGGSSRSSSSNTSIVETDNSNLQQNDNALAFNLDDVSVEGLTDSSVSVNVSDAGAIERAFEFGGDALDFGTQSLQRSQDFGRDILNEASDISREAIQVAGNAQTNAFSKIREITTAFTNGTSTTTTRLLVLGAAVTVLALVFFLTRKRTA